MTAAAQSSVVPFKLSIPSLAMDEGELISVLTSSIYPGAKVESVKLVIGYCRAGNLDPLQKPVHIVPMDIPTGKKDSDGWDIKEKRDVVMPGIGLYRIQAARTGEYAGISEPEFGEEGTLEGTVYPKWCRVTVRRIVQGQVVEFTAKELWLENYATKGRSSKAPNTMWAKRPYAQLAKCAEAQALRKAFPEIGAQPTAEEMEGKEIDIGGGQMVEAAPKIEGPRPKATVEDAAFVSTAKAQTKPAEEPHAEAPPPSAAASAPMNPSQVNIIRAKLKSAALNELDLDAKFPGKCLEPVDGKTQFTVIDFNEIVKFINERATAN